ncbi:MAG: biotin--[acetyl-CoA-carboxylase] ligase [Desulfobulbus propionicus]|nr:MAG: biotin--[acetyl-CoA-carboxylase] ligase [Desulfobulbus propionicus]
MELTHAMVLDRARELFYTTVTGADEVLRYGAPVGSVIEYHRCLGRCMERLEELLSVTVKKDRSLPCGTVIIAGHLNAAVGRFNRQWHAPQGGLWLAMAWSDTLLPAFAGLLPLSVGIACCETIRMHGITACLKWVNDVHVRGRKLAGILCRTITAPEGQRYHLLGVGINGNNQDFPDELRDTAISMRALTGCTVELQQLALDLLARLVWNIGLLHLQEADHLENGSQQVVGLPGVVSRWKNLSDTVGRDVVFGHDVQRTPLYRAKVLDIDRWGGLVLRLGDGAERIEYAGELLYC